MNTKNAQCFSRFERERWRLMASGHGRMDSPSAMAASSCHASVISQCFIPGDPKQRAAAFLPWNARDNLIYTRDFEQSVWFR